MVCGFQLELMAANVPLMNLTGINIAAKNKTLRSNPTSFPTKNALIINITIPTVDNIPLEMTAVFPESTFLAISLATQYPIAGSITTAYVKKPDINPHIAYSLGVKVLVTIRLKIILANTITSATTNAIIPVYVTLIPDKFYNILTF